MAITVTGLDELSAKITATKKTIPKKLDLAMNDTADAIMLKAMRLVPVATNVLRNSIGTNLQGFQHKIIYANADYANKIEYGEPIGGNPKLKTTPKGQSLLGHGPLCVLLLILNQNV